MSRSRARNEQNKAAREATAVLLGKKPRRTPSASTLGLLRTTFPHVLSLFRALDALRAELGKWTTAEDARALCVVLVEECLHSAVARGLAMLPAVLASGPPAERLVVGALEVLPPSAADDAGWELAGRFERALRELIEEGRRVSLHRLPPAELVRWNKALRKAEGVFA